MLRRLIVAALLLGSPAPALAAAAADAPRFVDVAPSEVPGSVISALAEDSEGFIWLGTPAGLVRYDGYRFRLFGNDWSVPGTLSTVFVRSLVADAEGAVWAGSDFSGLLRHAPGAERLERIALKPDTSRPLSINALALDRQGGLWAGSDGDGLFHRDAEGRVRHYRAGDGSGLPDDRIDSLLVERDGSLWVGSWSGLARRGAGDAQFTTVSSAGVDTPPRISALLQDAAGRVWAGSRGGQLLRLDADGRLRLLDGSETAAPASVHALLEADDGMLWVARGDGIELRDLGDGRLRQRLRHAPEVPHGLDGNEIRALLRDRGGQLWVAGYGSGLQRHDPHNTAFQIIDRHSAAGRLLGDPNIRSVAALRDGRVLLGSQDRGIALLDSTLQPIDLLRDARGEPLFLGVRIAGLAEAADGNWWIGSDAGLFWRAPHDPTLHQVAIGPGKVRRLMADPDGSVWVASESGLFRAEVEALQAEPIATIEGPPMDGDVNALAIDATGALWIGGDQGLAVREPGGTAARWVPAVHPAREQNPDVLGLLADAHGRLWFDTPIGLFRREPVSGGKANVLAVSDGHGAAGQPFGANLLDDAAGRVWTQHRVFDPALQRIVSLSAADGVEMGAAWFRAYARTGDGRLLFGGSRGLLVVHPERYRIPDYDAPLVITALQRDGQPLPAPRSRQIELPAEARRLTVEFAALDYSAPERLRYRHRVLGEDPAWRESDAAYRVATLANLAPGDYRLEVQASDRHGRWTASQLALDVRVLPAFWQRPVFHLTLAALLVLAVQQLVRWRTRWLRARRDQLESRVAQRTHELEQLSQALRQKSAALEQASLTDPLTGLRNRRYFAAHIDADVARSRRRHLAALAQQQPARNADLIFFLVDLDHFKQVNDEFGHAAGDAVLIQMRERLQACFRDVDHLVRWGGEEFLVVSRDSERSGAAELARRAVAAVSDFAFELPGRRRLRCSCSIGFSALPLQPQHPGLHGWEEAVELADIALYAAKHAGRNGWVGIEIAALAPLSSASLRHPAVLIASGSLLLRSSLPEAEVHTAIQSLSDTSPLASG